MEAGTDNELMVRVKEGHTGELGVLFERHHARLLNFFRLMTGNRAVAEDLVQEVFIRMLRYRSSFRGDGGFLPWMYTLARNAATDHFRKVSRRKESPEEETETVSEAPSASEELEKEQTIRSLRKALMRLAPEKREVLILSRFNFVKFEEIARILDCPVSTAKVRAHRAIKELRQIYLGQLSETSP